MKKSTKVLWGTVLVLLGIVFALNALGITQISLFFKGWWTLFIIVPSLIGLCTERNKSGNAVVLLIGIVLFLACRDVISFSVVRKLGIPVIIIFFGLKLIFGGHNNKKDSTEIKRINELNIEKTYATATFSGNDINFDNRELKGAELNAIFGGVDFKASNAIINSDCVINASAIFGGIDIYLPANVNVKVQSTSIFGGISNKRGTAETADMPTVYINAVCMFGGVEIH